MIQRGLLVAIVLLSAAAPGSAQSLRDAWRPPVQSITRDDHPGDHISYSITQDSRGFIYAGNDWGVLEFDGSDWRMVPMPPPSSRRVRAVAANGEGQVFFATQNDFGMIEVDENGVAAYRSLRHLVLGSPPEFSEAFGVIPLDQDLWIATDSMIVRLRGEQSRFWSSHVGFSKMLESRGVLYFTESDGTVLRLVGESMAPVAELGRLVSPVVAIASTGDETQLIATEDGSLYNWFRGRELRPIEIEGSDYLTDHSIEGAEVLHDGSIIIRTLRKGALWVDRAGKLLGTIDADHLAIGTGEINDVFEDRDGDVWLAMSDALVHLNLASPVHHFLGPSNGSISIGSIVIHQDQTIIGTDSGMYRAKLGDDGELAYEPLYPEYSRVGRFHSHGEALFFASHGDWYVREGDVVQPLGINGGKILDHPRDPNSVIVGSSSGLWLVSKSAVSGRWEPELALLEKREFVDLAFHEPGVLWAIVEPMGVIKVEFGESIREVLSVSQWLESVDYPMHMASVLSINGQLIFGSSDGPQRLDATSDSPFSLEPILPLGVSDREDVFKSIHPTSSGDIFAIFQNGVRLVRGWAWPESLLPGTAGIRAPLVDSSMGRDTFWGVNERGLVRIDSDLVPAETTAWDVVIRSVVESDSLRTYRWLDGTPVSLDRGDESVLVTFSGARYKSIGTTVFRYRIPEIDPSWSSWSPENRINLIRLAPGPYRLQIQGRDGLGKLSNDKELAFTIRPRWFRTGWAYAFWVMCLMGVGIAAALRLQSRHLRVLKENAIELERQVAARTSQLAEQADLLRELDSAKSRFFANLSHEFRTPLALLVGPIRELLRGRYGEQSDATNKVFARAARNADRLHRLINQLLDLSRLEGGSLKVNLTDEDLTHFCRRIISLFESAAQQRGIELSIAGGSDAIMARFDRDHMEKVLTNLLSNALKFTRPGGRITVSMTATESEAILKISDTGIGIAKRHLDQVFDRFFQVDDSSSRPFEGLGIGLAMSRDFMRAAGGDIHVESQEGVGSIFSVHLPLSERPALPEVRSEDQVMTSLVPPGDKIVGAPSIVNALPDNMESKPLLLVVEDNEDMQDYLVEMLMEDYTILQARDGIEGAEVAFEFGPDIVVSDVMMPGRDGLDLCELLRSDVRTSHIPIILLTARVHGEHRLEGLSAGADAYLAKPFDSRELRIQLANILERRERLKEAFSSGFSTGSKARPPQEILSPRDRLFMEELHALVDAEFYSSTFSVEQFSVMMHLSRRQLLRKMKALTGESPAQFIVSARMRRAAALLNDGSKSIQMIASEVGYLSRSQFSNQFRRTYGLPPSEYAAGS
jgi:signal transduction histidine kinase/DNA-binding response OmpR family regulator